MRVVVVSSGAVAAGMGCLLSVILSTARMLLLIRTSLDRVKTLEKIRAVYPSRMSTLIESSALPTKLSRFSVSAVFVNCECE